MACKLNTYLFYFILTSTVFYFVIISLLWLKCKQTHDYVEVEWMKTLGWWWHWYIYIMSLFFQWFFSCCQEWVNTSPWVDQEYSESSLWLKRVNPLFFFLWQCFSTQELMISCSGLTHPLKVFFVSSSSRGLMMLRSSSWELLSWTFEACHSLVWVSASHLFSWMWVTLSLCFSKASVTYISRYKNKKWPRGLLL